MTPELKTACEVVFQEHKVSRQPIKWDRDAFRGRISVGLSEMAKQTLVKKNIILLPNKTKRVFTQLNPDVARAANFEEAEKIIATKTTDQEVTPPYAAETPVADHVSVAATAPAPIPVHNLLPVAAAFKTRSTEIDWWKKPWLLYFVWPVCGAAGGALISVLMDFVYRLLFLNPK